MQTWHAYPVAELVEPLRTSDTTVVTQQTIAVGPAASQIAIKQLGTNGGGFFNVNSAHPFENPTPISNFLEMLAILLIPAALCEMFGRMVRDRRQGWVHSRGDDGHPRSAHHRRDRVEQRGTPVLAAAGADQAPSALQAGGNMEGKETRFGIVNSAHLGLGDDRGVQRLGQLHARQLHAAWRPHSDVADPVRRGRVRRGRARASTACWCSP